MYNVNECALMSREIALLESSVICCCRYACDQYMYSIGTGTCVMPLYNALWLSFLQWSTVIYRYIDHVLLPSVTLSIWISPPLPLQLRETSTFDADVSRVQVKSQMHGITEVLIKFSLTLAMTLTMYFEYIVCLCTIAYPYSPSLSHDLIWLHIYVCICIWVLCPLLLNSTRIQCTCTYKPVLIITSKIAFFIASVHVKVSVHAYEYCMWYSVLLEMLAVKNLLTPFYTVGFVFFFVRCTNAWPLPGHV